MPDTIEDGSTVYTFDTLTGFYRDENGAFLLTLQDPMDLIDTDCCQ